MSRRPNGSCSRCNRSVWRSASSRPEIVCRDCRRTDPQPYGTRGRSIATQLCAQCGSAFRRRKSVQRCNRARKAKGGNEQLALVG